MEKENIFDPELSLIRENEYYLFYEMMMQALKTDNVKEGVNKSLYLLREYLQSDDIVLYRKNDVGAYIYQISDSPSLNSIKTIGCIVNKTKTLTEAKKIFELEFNITEEIKNMMLIHVKLSQVEGILAINNYNKTKEIEPHFWKRLEETMHIILKRAAIYERNTQAINTDLLTGLDNRNAYEMRIRSLNEMDAHLVFGVFDLFRLKYINDNYNHNIGDTYIKEAAKILSKYWPKNNVTINDNGMETYTSTGHSIYRVGGDEFILLTSAEDINLTMVKANLAAEEVSMIKLPIGDHLPLGLNYGIVLHNPGDFIKNTYANADKIMAADKTKMYKKYGLDRRR